jgi:hypothetical protein
MIVIPKFPNVCRYGVVTQASHASHASQFNAAISFVSTCLHILVGLTGYLDSLSSSSIGSELTMDPPASSSSGEAGPSQAGLGKRKRSLTNMIPGSRALQTKKARKAFAMRPKKPKKPSDWHMRKGEVPKEAEKTKVHIHFIQAL